MLIEVAFLLSGAIWLAFRPSWLVVVPLILYQAVGLFINGVAFAEAERNTPIHKALLVHLSLRVLAVAGMVFGLVLIEKERRKAEANRFDEDGLPLPTDPDD